MSQEVTVIAQIKAKPGLEEELKNELLALVPPTVLERGCVTYQLHQSADDKSLFMFYETWTSKRALEDHLDRPHLVTFLGKADQLFAEPVQITLWHMID